MEPCLERGRRLENSNPDPMIEKTYSLELTIPVAAHNDDDAEERMSRIIDKLEDLFGATVTITNTETTTNQQD